MMTRNSFLLVSAPIVILIACAPPPEAALDKASQSQGIYYGTRDPQNVSLSEGQKLAIGWFFTPGRTAEAWCSGTLIAPRVVASAEHCLQGVGNLNQVGFGVGTMPTNPTATFSIEAVHPHSSRDAALFILSQDATQVVPNLVPIQMNRQHPSAWLNDRLDAAGYGQTHDGSIGRYFASVWLERVDATTVEVNGRGEQGICFGDSGGPLLAPGPVVVAVESYGDPSCVGRDTMVRLDALESWIDPIVDSHGGGGTPDDCGGLDYLGRCNGDIAEWCENGQIRQYDCSQDDMTCGYIDDEIGYYCVPRDEQDHCDGLDYLGRCNGDIAEWCDGGQVVQYDCSRDGMTCGWVDDETGYYCVERQTEDPCAGIGPSGRCNMDVAEWCEDGELRSRDCSAEGLVCRYVNDEVGHSCVDPSSDPDPDDGGDGDGGGGGSGVGGCQAAGAGAGAVSWLLLAAAPLVRRTRRP